MLTWIYYNMNFNAEPKLCPKLISRFNCRMRKEFKTLTRKRMETRLRRRRKRSTEKQLPRREPRGKGLRARPRRGTRPRKGELIYFFRTNVPHFSKISYKSIYLFCLTHLKRPCVPIFPTPDSFMAWALTSKNLTSKRQNVCLCWQPLPYFSCRFNFIFKITVYFQCVTPTPLYHFRTNGLREELSALSKLREARVEEEEEKEELHGRKLQQEEMAKRARELAELCVTPVPLLPPVIGRWKSRGR